MSADDPNMAFMGYVAFFQSENGIDESIVFGHQFAKPVTKKHWVSNNIDENLEICMDKDLDLCDDLAKNVVGFAKYSAIESVDESEGIFFNLKDVRNECDEKTFHKYSEFRKNKQ